MKIRFGSTGRGRAMKPIEAVIFGLIFTLCGVALLFYSFQTIKSYKEKDAKYIEVTAEVVDYKENSEGLLAIVAEYEVDGEKYSKTSSVFSSSPQSIGSKVSIKYNPINPKDAIWKNDSTNLVLPLVSTGFTLVGLLIFITGILGFKKKNKLDDSDEVNKAINDFETTQNENNVVTNTLGAVAAPVAAALSNIENATTNDIPASAVSTAEPAKEEIAQPVAVNEQVTEEVVSTNLQNTVSENNEIQVETPVEVIPTVEVQQVVESVPSVEPVIEATPEPVVENTTINDVPVAAVPTSEPVETSQPVAVNEQVAEEVVPTNLQNTISENNEIQVETPVEVIPTVEVQQVVESVPSVEPVIETTSQPVVENTTINDVPVSVVPTSEPVEISQPVAVNEQVTEEVVSTNLQNSVSENNEIQVEKPVEITPIVEVPQVVESVPNVQPVIEATPEPVVENVSSITPQNTVVENATTNDVPASVGPTSEPVKEEIAQPVAVNEQVTANVIPTTEQNVVESVNNNM